MDYDDQEDEYNSEFLSNAEEADDTLVGMYNRIMVIDQTLKDLKAERDELTKDTLLYSGGKPQFLRDLNGQPYVARRETTIRKEVNYEALVKMLGVRKARALCKPPEVDSKRNGRWQRAVERGDIPEKIVHAAETEKESSAWVRFVKVEGA